MMQPKRGCSIMLVVALMATCLLAAQTGAAPPEAATTKAPTTKAPTTMAPTTKPPTHAPTPAVKCAAQTSKPEASKTTPKYNMLACILMQFDGYIQLAEKNFLRLGEGKVNEGLSNCENDRNKTMDPKLVVDFECGQLVFDMSKEKESVFVKSISGNFKTSKGASNEFKVEKKMFETSDNAHYYTCKAEQQIVLKDKTELPKLMVAALSYEVYRNSTSTSFYKTAEECAIGRSGFGFIIYALAISALIVVAYFVVRIVSRKDDY